MFFHGKLAVMGFYSAWGVAPLVAQVGAVIPPGIGEILTCMGLQGVLLWFLWTWLTKLEKQLERNARATNTLTSAMIIHMGDADGELSAEEIMRRLEAVQGWEK